MKLTSIYVNIRRRTALIKQSIDSVLDERANKHHQVLIVMICTTSAFRVRLTHPNLTLPILLNR
jgi:hypothetical protein